jgi:hypothetical protein
MRTILRKGGYSIETAATYIDSSKPVYSLSVELEPQHKWQNNEPTEEIIGYRAWFSQEGLEPFEVKFASKVKLPNYLAKVEFDQLEACEVRTQVYFRAAGLKEVK